MNLPRVLDGGAYTRRLHPISMNVFQSLAPLSTCNMELPPTDSINNLDWVEIPTPDGKVEYYRVANVATDTATGEKSVYLEHGACTLGDILIPETSQKKETSEDSRSGADLVVYPENKTGTISTLLTYILSKQTRWSVGTVAESVAAYTIYMELGDFTLLDCLSSLMQYIPDYQMEFQQISSTDWRINIKARPEVPMCEGRLSRNLKTCDVTYNTANICTRVYSEFLKQFPAYSGGYMDAATVNTYGVHAETMTLNDNLTAAQKVQIIGTYLNRHCTPTLSINISAVELSQITGLTIDKFEVGAVCRVTVPWLNIVEDEVIIDKRYSDCYNTPEDVALTLANATPDLAIAMAAVTSSAGGAGASGRGGAAGLQKQTEKEKKRFETHFQQTDEYFRLLATDTQWDDLGNGTLSSYAQVVINSSAFQTVVSNEREQTNTTITQTADAITANVTEVASGLQSDITEQAGRIDLVVAKKDGQNVIKSAEIIAAINGDESSVLIDADKIGLAGYTVAGDFEVTGSLTGHLYGGVDATGEGEQVLANVGNFTELYYNESVDMGDAFVSVTDGAYVDNVKTVTFTKANGETAPITFSRAITSFNAVGSNGTITITASPQEQDYTLIHAVKSMPVNGQLTANCTSNVYKDSEVAANIVDGITIKLVKNDTNKTVEAQVNNTAIAQLAVSFDEYESAGTVITAVNPTWAFPQVSTGGTVYYTAAEQPTTVYTGTTTVTAISGNGVSCRANMTRYGKGKLYYKISSAASEVGWQSAGDYYWYHSDTEQSAVTRYAAGNSYTVLSGQTLMYGLGDTVIRVGNAEYLYRTRERTDYYVKKST